MPDAGRGASTAGSSSGQSPGISSSVSAEDLQTSSMSARALPGIAQPGNIVWSLIQVQGMVADEAAAAGLCVYVVAFAARTVLPLKPRGFFADPSDAGPEVAFSMSAAQPSHQITEDDSARLSFVWTKQAACEHKLLVQTATLAAPSSKHDARPVLMFEVWAAPASLTQLPHEPGVQGRCIAMNVQPLAAVVTTGQPQTMRLVSPDNIHETVGTMMCTIAFEGLDSAKAAPIRPPIPALAEHQMPPLPPRINNVTAPPNAPPPPPDDTIIRAAVTAQLEAYKTKVQQEQQALRTLLSQHQVTVQSFADEAAQLRQEKAKLQQDLSSQAQQAAAMQEELAKLRQEFDSWRVTSTPPGAAPEPSSQALVPAATNSPAPVDPVVKAQIQGLHSLVHAVRQLREATVDEPAREQTTQETLAKVAAMHRQLERSTTRQSLRVKYAAEYRARHQHAVADRLEAFSAGQHSTLGNRAEMSAASSHPRLPQTVEPHTSPHPLVSRVTPPHAILVESLASVARASPRSVPVRMSGSPIGAYRQERAGNWQGHWHGPRQAISSSSPTSARSPIYRDRNKFSDRLRARSQHVSHTQNELARWSMAGKSR